MLKTLVFVSQSDREERRVEEEVRIEGYERVFSDPPPHPPSAPAAAFSSVTAGAGVG